MSSSPVFVAGYRNQLTQLINAFGARPRVLWTPAAVPPSSSVLGSRIHSISVAQNDTTINSLQLALGNTLTLAANMGSPASLTYNGGGVNNDTITRATGDFVADGWRAGQRILVQGATTLTNDNVSVVTSVATGLLTLTPSVFTVTEAVASGAKLINMLLLGDISVPASAGSSTTVPAASGLSAAQIPAIFPIPDNFLILGPNDLLIGAAGTGMSTGKSMDVAVGGGDY